MSSHPTRYYSASDESTAIAVLEQLDLTGTNAETGIRWWNMGAPNLCDPIGLIVKTYGTYDENGNELSAPTYVPGWHFNIYYPTQAVIDSLLDYEIAEPQAPVRMLA